MNLDTPSLDELFGSCRSLIQKRSLDVAERAKLWALLEQAHDVSASRYVEEWLPYLEEFSHHWQRPLVKLDDVYALIRARRIAPFVRCTVSLEAMHQWLLENDTYVRIASGIEVSERIETQEESVALWMSACEDSWQEEEDRFEAFGITSTGSMIVTWRRPSTDELEEPAVVLFGDEGELVGLAPSLQGFAHLLAYTFDPFDPSKLVYDFRPDSPVRDEHMSQPLEWDFPEDTRRYDAQGERLLRKDVTRQQWNDARVMCSPDDPPTRAVLQARFAKQIEDVFGATPAREELVEPTVELTAEFTEWVDQFFD